MGPRVPADKNMHSGTRVKVAMAIRAEATTNACNNKNNDNNYGSTKTEATISPSNHSNILH